MARLSAENTITAREIISRYPRPKSALIPLLHLAQEQDGHLTNDAMAHIAELIGHTPAEVLGTATFYEMFKFEPLGRYLVNICGTMSCALLGADELMHHAEHKLGIRASDTAAFRLENCRVPREDLLGSPDIEADKGFAGVMQTFDNTRPLVAAMAVGLTRACLEETRDQLAKAGIEIDPHTPPALQPHAAAELLAMEADYEAARLLTLEAAWMADNRKPNSLHASYAKAKAGRTCVDVSLRCVRLAGSLGYDEQLLLEKWARDAKILDIFEGTQQIQLLIVARQVLGKTSAELR